jgi:septal ring factor EnvC (AmiA/AmiB activator)
MEISLTPNLLLLCCALLCSSDQRINKSIDKDVSSVDKDVSSIDKDVSSIDKDVSSIDKDVSSIDMDVSSIAASGECIAAGGEHARCLENPVERGFIDFSLNDLAQVTIPSFTHM